MKTSEEILAEINRQIHVVTQYDDNGYSGVNIPFIILNKLRSFIIESDHPSQGEHLRTYDGKIK